MNKKVTAGGGLSGSSKKFMNKKPKNILGLFFVFSLIFIGSFVFTNKVSAETDCTATATTGVPQTECEALIALYNSTNGPGWTTKTNWNTASAVSTWYGIVVSGGHVTTIGITGNHLVGTIPSQIGNLPYLTSLNFWNNTISGSIPTEIGNLTNLTSLNLVTNALSGSIPTSIGNLTKLTVLILYGNPNMSGSLPSEIGNLVLLQNLNLSGNFTAGPIPASWNALINLKDLSLVSSHINGSIPTFISNFTQLTTLNLGGNSLTGSIPAELGNLIHLTGLGLQSNSLTSSIPAELGNLIHLTSLSIYSNQLTGSIPLLSGLTELVTLNVAYNQLTGSIPIGLSSTLRTVYLYYNKLSGSIPSNFASIPLTTFWIQNNNFVFSDMETDFSSYCAGSRSGFSYNPQYNVDTVRTVSVQAGNILTITPIVSANVNDIYQWYKDGSVISGATSRIFTKTALDSDTGVYSYRITNSVVAGLTLQSNNITVNILPNPPTQDIIYYIVSGNTTWVRGRISTTKDIAQSYIWNTTGNQEFDYGNTYIINSSTPNSISSYTTGTYIGGASDDSTPINTVNVGFFMEGHGINSPVVTSVGHNKTSADIGSTWSDGTHQFILAEISGNTLTFYSIPSGSPWVIYTSVAGTLTHVSDATHTGNITITSQVATQKYPIIKNYTKQTLINGITQTVDGDKGYSDNIDFIEEFDLVDPSTIIRTNNPWAWNDGQVWMHVRNVYHVTGGNTTIHSTYNITRPMNIAYFGINQTNYYTSAPYDATYIYTPKTKIINGYNFKNIQIADGSLINSSITGAYMDDVNSPPNREIILKKQTAENNYDIGFAFGYGPYGDTANNKRNCSTYSCWLIYNTLSKTYPVMIGGVGVVNSVTYDAYAYRQWIDPKQYDIGKLAYWNNQNGRDLVYVDYHRSAIADITALPSRFIGKSVRVVESENMQTPPTTIPGDGNLVLSTTGANTYGYAVLELTDAQSALPVATPSAGLYNTTQTVSLSATGSTSIRYATDITPADCLSGTLYSVGTPISVSTSQTIYVRACNSFGNSSIASFDYTIDIIPPETPTATPSAGPYNSTQSVALSAVGSDYIKYDLSTPPATCSSGTPYGGQIPVSTSQTIYVRACDNAGNSSTESFAYTIDTTEPLTPVATPSSGIYNTTKSVTLSATDSDYIKYATDTFPATCSAGTSYSSLTPISISSSQTIYVIACDNAGNSSTESFEYTIDTEAPSTPIASPIAGLYNSTQSVTLSAVGSNYIKYSLDSFPADCSSGINYSGQISVPSTQTIYVRACDNAGNSSTESFVYTIDTDAPIEPPKPAKKAYTSSGTSVQIQVSNLLAMGNTKAAEELIKKFPSQFPTQTITPPTSPQTPPVITRTLKLKMTGDDVKALQVYLNTHGYTVSTIGAGSLSHETNYFGSLTKKAVISFQKANGLVPDGIVGVMTRGEMN